MKMDKKRLASWGRPCTRWDLPSDPCCTYVRAPLWQILDPPLAVNIDPLKVDLSAGFFVTSPDIARRSKFFH